MWICPSDSKQMYEVILVLLSLKTNINCLTSVDHHVRSKTTKPPKRCGAPLFFSHEHPKRNSERNQNHRPRQAQKMRQKTVVENGFVGNRPVTFSLNNTLKSEWDFLGGKKVGFSLWGILLWVPLLCA